MKLYTYIKFVQKTSIDYMVYCLGLKFLLWSLTKKKQSSGIKMLSKPMSRTILADLWKSSM
jgi:hypothetical protein